MRYIERAAVMHSHSELGRLLGAVLSVAAMALHTVR